MADREDDVGAAFTGRYPHPLEFGRQSPNVINETGQTTFTLDPGARGPLWKDFLVQFGLRPEDYYPDTPMRWSGLPEQAGIRDIRNLTPGEVERYRQSVPEEGSFSERFSGKTQEQLDEEMRQRRRREPEM